MKLLKNSQCVVLTLHVCEKTLQIVVTLFHLYQILCTQIAIKSVESY